LPSFRDIVRRIDSIKNTQKITKAMQVVAATRLRRAQAAVQATRPYADKMVEVLQTVGERGTEYKHPFLVRREGGRAVMILVTTDKGLCGAINVNNIRAATRYMNQTYPTHQQYVTLGRKGRDFLLRYRREVLAEVSNLPDRPSVGEVLPAVTVALEEYAKGNTDAVILCYSKWISTLRQEPAIRVLIHAEIPPALASDVRRLAVAAFRAVDAAGLARVDFFLDRASGQLYLNEINTMPGFTEISMYPKLWAASGISFPDLVTSIAELALERFGDRSRNQTTLGLE